MKSKMLAVFLIITLVAICWAEEKTGKKGPPPKHYFFNFSIYYPLSINKSKKDSVNLNLSLVSGHVGKVTGIDLAVLSSAVEDDLRGIQLTGLGGVVGDSMRGIQASGLFSIAGDRSAGIQSSGLFSITGDNFKGIQSAGLFSIVGEGFKGIQAAGLFSIVGNDFRGLQAAGLFSIVGDSFYGIQAAGLFNIAGEKSGGLQAGAVNIVGENFKGIQAGVIDIVGGNFKGLQAGTLNVVGDMLRGVQVGVVNLGVSIKGVQLGVVNISEEITGVPIGLANLSKEGRIRWVSWGSNVTPFNTGLKMMVNKVYSILSIGGVNLEKDISSSISYGFHYGVHFPLKKYFFDMDLGYVNIDNEKFFRSVSGDVDQHLLEGRAILGINISRHFSLFAGGGYGYMIDHYENFDTGKSLAVFFAGIELFNFNVLKVERINHE